MKTFLHNIDIFTLMTTCRVEEGYEGLNPYSGDSFVQNFSKNDWHTEGESMPRN